MFIFFLKLWHYTYLRVVVPYFIQIKFLNISKHISQVIFYFLFVKIPSVIRPEIFFISIISDSRKKQTSQNMRFSSCDGVVSAVICSRERKTVLLLSILIKSCKTFFMNKLSILWSERSAGEFCKTITWRWTDYYLWTSCWYRGETG